MKPGDMILAELPQADGNVKNRPAVVLREMRPYGDMLVCGVSTQSRLMVSDFDERIGRSDSDFVKSGLLADSIIRLGFLAVLPRQRILGSIGAISNERNRRLLHRLSADSPTADSPTADQPTADRRPLTADRQLAYSPTYAPPVLGAGGPCGQIRYSDSPTADH